MESYTVLSLVPGFFRSAHVMLSRLSCVAAWIPTSPLWLNHTPSSGWATIHLFHG